MSKAISKKRDFSKITVNGQPLEVLSVLDIEVPVWRDPEKGEVWVYLRPVVDQLGLSWKPQFVKVAGTKARRAFRDTVTIMVTVSANPTNPEEQLLREALFIRREGFFLWLSTLNPNKTRIPEELDKFQLEAMRALDRYFSEGVAVNPEVARTAPQHVAKTFTAHLWEALSPEKRAEMLTNVLSVLEEGKYKQLLARILAAELTGHAGFLPAPQDLPVDLTTWARDRLSREGISLPYEKLRSFAQGMGQRAAHLYKAHYGEPPEKRTQEIGGVVRTINAYYLPQHEGVLEEAFQKTLQDWHDKKKL